ncbi:NOP5-2 [Symbiodinium sp. KB8]|nr:NOP5-2 [Symbiodinium sp. KB8]
MMVGELVGARLIAHAGSLLNLAKQPASTIQILGAEKALFRALKTKHETPKYGLIYHASLVGQSAPKNKGKVSRMLASKTALSVRVDALGESSEPTVALEGRAKVEARMRQLETGQRYELIMGAKGKTHTPAVASSDAGSSAAVNPESDIVLTPAKKSSEKTEKSSKKKSKVFPKMQRKASEVSPEDTMVTPKKSDSEKKEKKSAKKSEKKEKKSEKKEKKSAKKAKKSKE